MSLQLRKMKEDDAELAKIELERLKFNYRVIETDRKLFINDANYVLKSQEKQLKRLRDENNNMMLLLSIANNPLFLKDELKNENDIALLINARNEIKTFINNEINEKEDLLKEIKDLGDEIRDLEFEQARVIGIELNRNDIFSTLDATYNSLRNITANYDAKIKENQVLRNEIDELREQRKNNLFLLDQLEIDEKESAKELKHLSDENATAFEQRREGYSKISALKEKNDREERKFIADLRDLFRVIDHHDKLRSFMMQKVDSRSELKNEMQAIIRKSKPKLREKVYNIDEFNKIFSIHNSMKFDCLNDKENDFRNKFIELDNIENENYLLFCYNFKLQTEVDELQREIEKYENILGDLDNNLGRSLEERQNKFDKIEGQYEENYEKLKKCENQIEENEKTLNLLFQKIDKIFNKLECYKEGQYLMLEGEISSEINESNVLFHLELIEKRVNQFISAYYYNKFKEDPHFILRGLHCVALNREKFSKTKIQIGIKKIEFEENTDVKSKKLKNMYSKYTRATFNSQNLKPLDSKCALRELLNRFGSKNL